MVETCSGLRRLIVRLACVLIAGAVLAGCDRCGDFWRPGFQTQACKDQAPRPQ